MTVLDGNGITSDVKHYYGNLIYDGITLWPTRLLIDGGYVDVTSRLNSISYAYRFYVQDHQGNNRMVTDGSGTVLQVNHYDPYGQLLTSISSTSPVSQYKYGGKEWNPTSLSYDFGARNYLPAVPRWNSMDPLAEKYYSISPYVYCAGNPVNRVDFLGEWDITVHVFNNRTEYGYGVAVVTDRSGNEIYRFTVRAQGIAGENRLKDNADTPLGVYNIPSNSAWISGGNRASYGPNARLNMSGMSGEIIESGRSLIRIHG